MENAIAKAAQMTASASNDVIPLRTKFSKLVWVIFGIESRDRRVRSNSVRLSFKDKTVKYSTGFDLIHQSMPLKRYESIAWVCGELNATKIAYDAFIGEKSNKYRIARTYLGLGVVGAGPAPSSFMTLGSACKRRAASGRSHESLRGYPLASSTAIS